MSCASLTSGSDERDREDAVAQVEAPSARLDVHDDVAPRQRALERALDQIGGLMALDDGLPGRHADDHVGEVAPGGLSQAQPVELDVRPQRGDRALGDRSRLDRRTVHQHVRVGGDQAHGGHEDDHRHEQRRERVAVVEAGLCREQAREHQQRAGHVGREVRGVGAQRGAVLAAAGHQRDGHARGFQDQRGADRDELVPVHVAAAALPVRRVIASTLTSTPPPSSSAASPSAPRFSARR